MTLGGSPVQLTVIEYRMRAELGANEGRALTYEQLIRGSGGAGQQRGDLGHRGTVVSPLRRKLAGDANSSRLVYTEPDWPTGWRSREL